MNLLFALSENFANDEPMSLCLINITESDHSLVQNRNITDIPSGFTFSERRKMW